MKGRLGAWEHTDWWRCGGGAVDGCATLAERPGPSSLERGGKIYKNYLILVKQESHIQQVVVFQGGGQSKLWRVSRSAVAEGTGGGGAGGGG